MNVPNLDLAPVAPADLDRGVPLIDLGANPASVVELVGEACRDWGFFQVIGHGVAPELTEQVLSIAGAYFALPIEEKRRHLRSRENPWGFYDRELTRSSVTRSRCLISGRTLR